MAACQITGHPDSYGLGIRTAFYIQWFGIIVTSWLLEGDHLNLRFLNGLTTAATAVGLVLELGALEPAEVYVVLLLVCGTLYLAASMYLWRLLTCCSPSWDPARGTGRARMGWLFRAALALMSGALLSMQIWFWSAGVYETPPGDGDGDGDGGGGCQQYAFMFGQVPLDSPAVTAVNIILHLVILLVGTWQFAAWIGVFDECRWFRRRRRKRRRSISRDRRVSLHQLRTVSDLIVASILTAAVELVIAWNGISGVGDLDSAAQLIPPVVSGAYLVRSLYAWMTEWEEDDDDDDGTLPPDTQSDFVYFPYGSAGGAGYLISNDGTWAGRRPDRHHRRRHHRPRPGDAYLNPNVAYVAQDPMPGPQMTAAPAAAASGAAGARHATVEDDADGAAVPAPEPAAHPPSQPQNPA